MVDGSCHTEMFFEGFDKPPGSFKTSTSIIKDIAFMYEHTRDPQIDFLDSHPVFIDN